MLNPLDVIWIFDNLIDPPHPKMVACVNPADGVFYRINSRHFSEAQHYASEDAAPRMAGS